MSLTTSEILERAAELIEPEGVWTQSDLLPEGTLCPLLAIERASRGELQNLRYSARLTFRDYIHEKYDRADSIVEWNEEPGRTQSEVVQALRDAAAAARDASGGRA